MYAHFYRSVLCAFQLASVPFISIHLYCTVTCGTPSHFCNIKHLWKYQVFHTIPPGPQCFPCCTTLCCHRCSVLRLPLPSPAHGTRHLTTPTHWGQAWWRLCIRINYLISSNITLNSWNYHFSPQGDSHSPFPVRTLRRTLGMTWKGRSLEGFLLNLNSRTPCSSLEQSVRWSTVHQLDEI